MPSDLAPISDEFSAHQAQTRRYVGAMMKLTGRSATALARSAGLTPSTINRFMHRPVRHTLSQRTMLALMTETFLAIKSVARKELDAEAMAELGPAIAMYERGILERAPDVGPALAQIKASSTPANTDKQFPVDDLPVLLVSTHGVNVKSGQFTAAPLRTKRPPFLENDPLAFAVLMPDDSMAPRFDSGDILYVSPLRPLDGDRVDVVIDQDKGGFVVGTLADMTNNTVRISVLSPRRRQSYGRDKLAGVYRIVGVQRLGA